MGNTDSNFSEDMEPSSPGDWEPSTPGNIQPYTPGNIQPSPPGRGAGSRENPVHFQQQNYERIRNRLYRDQKLFRDRKFPAGEEALGPLNKPGIEWIRASELFTNPQFFVDSISMTDICQGNLGDCWFLAAMSSLTLDENLFAYVVPSDQSFQKMYAGIFRFRFWQYGKWVEVVVDDKLPTMDQKLVFTISSSRNELWSALLEKAYAKLYGSYASIVGGHVSVAMEDFTGGIAVSIKMSSTTSDGLWLMVKRALTQQTLASGSTEAKDKEDMEKDNGLGLLKAHAYAITEADRVKLGGSSVKLFRLRNPWGRTEYIGTWSDRSPLWNGVSDQEKVRLKLKIKDDGEFWIPADIFHANFTKVDLCSLQPLCQQGTPCVWTITSYEGKWMSGISAGGTDRATYSTNPQFRLTLLEQDDDPDDDQVSCTIAVELIQKYRRKRDKSKYYLIGFHIYAVPEKYRSQVSTFGKRFFNYNRPVYRSDPFTDSRSISRRLQLPPGEYIIVPATYTKNQEAEFLLRIFAKWSNVSRENSITTNDFNPKITWTEADATNAKPLLNALQDAEDQGESLSASEFMELFNSVARSDAYHLSLEACCSLVFVVNAPGEQGWLSAQEVKRLAMNLNKLQGIFEEFVDKESGLMHSHDLRPALSAAGFELDSTVHQGLWLRHRTSTDNICFSHFISCVAKMHKLFAIYKGLKNTKPKDIDQWLLLFIGI
ncbi:calpain-2 catalytic subunit-like [Scyliorhinus torazame]|uniref:calpain-2 catalytic subunit-like n=1 Tax=Scyliorhinus torazame TaxID=75743 RepID=UPI003B59D13C